MLEHIVDIYHRTFQTNMDSMEVRFERVLR